MLRLLRMPGQGQAPGAHGELRGGDCSVRAARLPEAEWRMVPGAWPESWPVRHAMRRPAHVHGMPVRRERDMSELAEIAVYDARSNEFAMVTRQEAIDGIMRRAATMRPGEPARAVVESTALALARYGAVDALAVANMWDPPKGQDG